MNKLYRIGDSIQEWFVATSKEQLLEYYHKEYSDDLKLEDIEEETELNNGYWNGSTVTEEDIEEFINDMKEYYKEENEDEDYMYYPENNDTSGDIRYYDEEYWKWETFEEVINKYKDLEDVKEPEKICSTEY